MAIIEQPDQCGFCGDNGGYLHLSMIYIVIGALAVFVACLLLGKLIAAVERRSKERKERKK